MTLVQVVPSRQLPDIRRNAQFGRLRADQHVFHQGVLGHEEVGDDHSFGPAIARIFPLCVADKTNDAVAHFFDFRNSRDEYIENCDRLYERQMRIHAFHSQADVSHQLDRDAYSGRCAMNNSPRDHDAGAYTRIRPANWLTNTYGAGT